MAVVSFVMDVWHTNSFNKNVTMMIIIIAMIFASGTVRFIQEIRSKHAYDQLDRLVHTLVNVKRDGVIIKIPAEDLVVGDCVYLSAGDRIPADMRLTNTLDMFVSQAAITGESGILEKTSRKHGYTEQIAFSQYESLIFMGTTVISGKGEGVVLAVGKETLYGNFIQPNTLTSNSFKKVQTQLQKFFCSLWLF